MLEHVEGQEPSLVWHVPYRVLLLNTEESGEYMNTSVPLESFTVDPIEMRAVCEGILAQCVAGCCGTKKPASKPGYYIC